MKTIKLNLSKNFKIKKIVNNEDDNVINIEIEVEATEKIKEKIKENFIPQQGDIVYNEELNSISIFKSQDQILVRVYCGYAEGILCIDDPAWSLPTRLASDIEKQVLFKALENEGLYWNAEKQQIEKIRWRAPINGEYFLITPTGNIESEIESNSEYDSKFWEYGNYFKTEAIAKQTRDFIKEKQYTM